MALQGTIDAFPLTDVLQLLSSSARTGRLQLDGDRGRAELWIDDGAVVGGDVASSVDGAPELVFELLRFGDGSFVFDAVEGPPPLQVEPRPLAESLRSAEDLLEEWRRIEDVVPSMRHRVGLCAQLADPEVTVSADEWVALVAAGDSPTVATAAERLGLSDVTCCTLLASLVERSLLAVDEPVDEPTDQRSHAPLDEPVEPSVSDHREPPVEVSDEAGGGGFPDRFPIDELLGEDRSDTSAWSGDGEPERFAAAQTFEPLGSAAFGPATPDSDPDLPVRTAEAWDEVVSGQVPVVQEPWVEPSVDADDQQATDDTADEVLRQMSRLSPKAAEAIAAALNGPASTTPASHPAAERTGGDEPSSFMGSF